MIRSEYDNKFISGNVVVTGASSRSLIKETLVFFNNLLYSLIIDQIYGELKSKRLLLIKSK
jgi:hypothetical protein